MKRKAWYTKSVFCCFQKAYNGIWISFVNISLFPDFFSNFHWYYNFSCAGRGFGGFYFPFSVFAQNLCLIYPDNISVQVLCWKRADFRTAQPIYKGYLFKAVRCGDTGRFYFGANNFFLAYNQASRCLLSFWSKLKMFSWLILW